jgi:hypothetical protein
MNTFFLIILTEITSEVCRLLDGNPSYNRRIGLCQCAPGDTHASVRNQPSTRSDPLDDLRPPFLNLIFT